MNLCLPGKRAMPWPPSASLPASSVQEAFPPEARSSALAQFARHLRSGKINAPNHSLFVALLLVNSTHLCPLLIIKQWYVYSTGDMTCGELPGRSTSATGVVFLSSRNSSAVSFLGDEGHLFCRLVITVNYPPQLFNSDRLGKQLLHAGLFGSQPGLGHIIGRKCHYLRVPVKFRGWSGQLQNRLFQA
jgi:hypothetical protein